MRGADLDEVVDDREVCDLGGEEWDAVDVGCGGDRQIDRPSAGLAPAFGDRGGESAPFAGDGSVDGEGIEGCFYNAESLRSASALVGVGCDECPEVKLGERRGADRAFELAGIESEYVSSAWKSERLSLEQHYGRGVVATRDIIDTSQDIWAVPTDLLAWLINDH